MSTETETPLTLDAATAKLTELKQAITDANKAKAFAQLRALITAATLLNEAYPEAADAHLISAEMIGHAVLDTITDKLGNVLWTADQYTTNYGRNPSTLPDTIVLVNQLLETVGYPHEYMMRITRAGMVAYIKNEERQKHDSWRDRFKLPLSWD
jgi:hypothetical protein